jgi:cysteine desulfurase/selenocysteine lyase
MNIKKIRYDFPFFGTKDASKGLVYLDSAATSQKPNAVIDALYDFYVNQNASVHRGVYQLSEQATTNYEATRRLVAQFINAADPSEIVFNSGATEGINSIADTWGRQTLKAGDEILLTHAEHHSNFLPWQRLAAQSGATLRFIPLNSDTFEFENPQDYLSKKTKLVALSPVSNVLGSVWTTEALKAFIAKAHSLGARVLLDACQSVSHERLNVQDLNADFVVFSGHKMLAPTGIGVLYIKKELHDSIEPYRLGGGMVHSAGLEKSSWRAFPEKFEAGTPPIAQVIGLGAAIKYFNENINFEELADHEAALTSRLLDGLLEFDSLEILGNIETLKLKGHLVSFVIPGVHAHDLASFLDMRGVMVRAGNHCAQPLFDLLGHDAALRVSFHCYTTMEDVELLLQGIALALDYFKQDS